MWKKFGTPRAHIEYIEKPDPEAKDADGKKPSQMVSLLCLLVCIFLTNSVSVKVSGTAELTDFMKVVILNL